jgi:Ca-activated chloride channel family protein
MAEQVPGTGRTKLEFAQAAAVAQEQYQEGEPNLVVLVTDGRNEDTTGGIDRDTLLRTLTEEQDPARPVGITTIAYGADADVESLALVSEATGGLAYVSPNPAQIGQILVAAFSGGRAGLLPGDATAPAVPGD